MHIDDLYHLRNWLVVSPLFLISLCVVFFIAGWIFPVEGPIDFIYDNHVKKSPSKSAPAIKDTKIEELTDEDIKEFCDNITLDIAPFAYMYCKGVSSLD